MIKTKKLTLKQIEKDFRREHEEAEFEAELKSQKINKNKKIIRHHQSYLTSCIIHHFQNYLHLNFHNYLL